MADQQETPTTSTLKTSDVYKTGKLPERFDNPEMLKGYGPREQNPIYQSTSSQYGMFAPNIHTVPTAYHGRSQKFSAHQGQAGMSRGSSMNTATDKSHS